MNIEDLSKTQLLLLTILVNFVTSIATGVFTVSLLDQAPLTVTQTVDRIVERTIQTVATGTPLQNIVVPKPTPPAPVVTDEDLLTRAFALDASRTVYIYGKSTTTPMLGIGTYLPKSRAIATASDTALPTEALIVFPDGLTVPASESHVGATLTIYGFSDTATLPAITGPGLVASNTLKQGQTVIALGKDGSAVTGIVSKVDETGIHTSLSGVPVGAAGVNKAGDLIGIAIDSLGTFATADKITTLLTATSTPAK